jgi:hypothetical protein
MRTSHQRALRLLGVSAGALGLVAALAQPSSAATNPVFNIRNNYTVMCLGVASQTGNGAPVIQWPCNGAPDEQWEWIPTKDNRGALAWEFKNTYSHKCIGVGSSLTAGAKLIQYTCNDAIDEKWYGDYTSGMSYLENVYSGKYAEPSSSAEGANVIQRYKVAGDFAQWWNVQSTPV